jgi:hypothetical protein
MIRQRHGLHARDAAETIDQPRIQRDRSCIRESEIRALIAANPAVWERVADEVESRLQLAA